MRKSKKVAKKAWEKEESKKRQHEEVNVDDAGADDDNDWNDLAHEERMAKKLKKGGISQKDFDMEFGDL